MLEQELAEPAPNAALSGGEAHLDDPDFLRSLRASMFNFARLHLADEHLAEDAVQEALVGALKNAASFGRRAAFKTWVFAILKNKITDILRQRHKLVEASRLINSEDDENEINALFNSRGFWLKEEHPQQWAQPLEQVKNDQFWQVFDACLSHLPAAQARLFMMREFLELDSDEICATAGISTSNLHVMLYRARVRLRECLENKWFSKGEIR